MGAPQAYLATCCNLAGAAAYCSLCVYVDAHAHEKGTDMDQVAMAFLLARVLDGIGIGIILQFSLVSITHLFGDQDRPAWMTLNSFAVMLGIGFGPLLAVAIVSLDGCDKDSDHFTAGGISYVGTALVSFAITQLCFPARLDMPDCSAPASTKPADSQSGSALTDKDMPDCSAPASTKPADSQSGSALTDKEQGSRVSLILACLTMNGLRAFVISGLESATSLLLETQFKWRPTDVGIAIGVCFLFSIPVKSLHGRLQKMMRLTSWIQAFSVAAILGTLLLFPFAARLPGLDRLNDAYILLLGDSVLFPTLMMGDALTAGLMMQSQHLLPVGSWFDANHVMLYRGVIVAGVGRCIGPPSARMQVDQGGQTSYAMLQLAGAGLFLVMLEVAVKPRVASTF